MWSPSSSTTHFFFFVKNVITVFCSDLDDTYTHHSMTITFSASRKNRSKIQSKTKNNSHFFAFNSEKSHSIRCFYGRYVLSFTIRSIACIRIQSFHFILTNLIALSTVLLRYSTLFIIYFVYFYFTHIHSHKMQSICVFN